MKKNKLLKFVNFSVMLVMCLSMFSFSFATSIIPIDENGESLVEPDISDMGSAPNVMANTFIGILKWIGYVIAVGMVIFIGIRYTMAAADEKANMKGVLIKVVIGALIIVFANTIVNIMISIAEPVME